MGDRRLRRVGWGFIPLPGERRRERAARGYAEKLMDTARRYSDGHTNGHTGEDASPHKDEG